MQCSICGKALRHFPCLLYGSGMGGDVEMNGVTSVMRQDDEDKQQPTNSILLSHLFHLLSQTQWSHISPNLLDVGKTVCFGS